MNIKQVKYFASVAEHGSLSAAAKDQFVTVQAVSKAIADLERELGTKLFVRESRGVRLTAFGTLFLQKADKALASFDELETFTQDLAANRLCSSPLSLMVCIPNFHLSSLVCRSVGVFVERQLGAKVKVGNGSLEECMKALEQRSVDGFVIIGSLEAPGIEVVRIGNIEPALMMAKRHPLSKRPSITLKEAGQFPFAIPNVFDCFYDTVKAALQDHPDFPKVIQDADSSGAAYAKFVASGGLMMVASVKPITDRFPGLCTRPLAPEDSLPVPVSLCVRAEERSDSLDVLVRFITNGFFKMSVIEEGEMFG